MNKQLWEKSTEFHGHKCPGLAIGFKVCEAVLTKMNIDIEKDDIVCITENNTCSVDAIRFILKCKNEGKNLIYKLNDKQRFSFFNKTNGEKLTVELKDLNKDKKMDREEFMNYLLKANIDEILSFSQPIYSL